MTIEIHQPELEALILRRMTDSHFQSVEDLLLAAMQRLPENGGLDLESATGELLIAAMQACPYPETNIEPFRIEMSPSEPVSL